MAGIYIHFPFCKQACHYCNFHFSTNSQFTKSYLKALHKEITLRKGYLTEEIETIYIGGGTPSLMSLDSLIKLFGSLYDNYHISEEAEVTLESNPDDLAIFQNEYLQNLRNTAVNRLSIGVQSFDDKDLRFMNRAHDSKEAITALKNSVKAGFENITADLIYGTPTLSDHTWLENLQRLIDLNIPHISVYALTVEEGTALDRFIKKGSVDPIDDHKVAYQFEMMVDTLESNGYEHYEISNFGKPGFRSKHNTNYWKGVPYIGLGPSAHSFNGTERQWNVADTPKYIKGLEQDELDYEMERLSINDRYNEYIMTSLRTIWGVELEQIKSKFGEEFVNHFKLKIGDELDEKVTEQHGNYTLTRKGKLYADRIASDLFKI